MTPEQEREAEAIRERLGRKRLDPDFQALLASAPENFSGEQKRIIRWAFGTNRPSAAEAGDAA